MKNALKINLLIILFFLFALLVNIFHFPYLLYLAGLLLFFLPGLNVAWTIEGLSKTAFGIGKLSVWTFFITPFCLPLLSYVFVLKLNSVSSQVILASIFVTLALSLVALAITVVSTKRPITKIYASRIKNIDKYLFVVLVLLLIFLVVNFLLYRFVPEADGYGYMARINGLIAEKRIASPNLSRPLFYTYILDLMALTKLPIFWIFKVVLPLIASAIFIPFYLLGKKYFKNINLVFVSLLPFYFPVVAMELLYPRPQIVFISSIVFVLYLIAEIKKEEHITSSLALILFAFIGSKYHEFFMLLILISIVGLLAINKSEILKKPFRFLAGTFVLLVIVYPWMRDMKLIEAVVYFFKPFIYYALHPKFNLWFIDSYVNTDGNPMGWPGYSWILYYGYNLGIAFPLLMLTALFSKKIHIAEKRKTPFIVIFTMLLFLAIAEIYPRLGLGFLPDRAWLFVAITFSYIALIRISNLKDSVVNSRIWKVVIAIIVILSFASSWYVTHKKQGWVTKNESAAAEYLKHNTPSNAVIITQGTNDPLVTFFAERCFLMPPGYFFLENNPAADDYYLNSIPELLNHKNQLMINRSGLIESSLQTLIGVQEGTVTEAEAQGKVVGNMSELQKIGQLLSDIEKNHLDSARPVYVMYSSDKFKTMNNSREWFRKANFAEADLDKFSAKAYTLVYQKQGVYIWRVNE